MYSEFDTDWFSLILFLLCYHAEDDISRDEFKQFVIFVCLGENVRQHTHLFKKPPHSLQYHLSWLNIRMKSLMNRVATFVHDDLTDNFYYLYVFDVNNERHEFKRTIDCMKM